MRIAGVQTSTDQDGFMWSVSDEDARRRWSLELQGIAGALTVVDVFTVEFADNGTDVVGKSKLFTLGTRGARSVTADNLVFEPGDYLLGVAHAGGGSDPRAGGGLLPVDVDSKKFGAETDIGAPDVQASVQEHDASGDPEVGAYRLTVREGDKLVVQSRTPDNGIRASAAEIRVEREHAAFYSGEESWLRLDVPEERAGQRWLLEAQTAVGRRMEMALFDGSRDEALVEARTDDRAWLRVPDLGLSPGSYWIRLASESGDVIRTFSSTATGQRVAGEEAEPNDGWRDANRIDLTVPTTGRAGVKGDEDYFAFDWPEDRRDRTFAIRLESPQRDRLKFCLVDAEGRDVQCRQGRETVELVDLLLAPGVHGVRVDRMEEGTEYRIAFAEGDRYHIGREAEPNDRVEESAALTDRRRVRGRFAGRETDVFRITVTEEPQLWRFQAIGGGVSKMIYYDGSGAKVEETRFSRDARRVRMPNLFLLPGNHYVALEGEDSEYTLLARAAGAPDMNAEREPNDDESRYHRIDVGQTRSGLLSEDSDLDGYRFFLAHWDRVRLTATPPPDGALRAEMQWERRWNLRQSADPGESLVLEGVFPPGNYDLQLTPQQVSEAEYSLQLERLPRFGCSADCEPNDYRSLASPLPRDLVIEGSTGDWYKFDFYRLPIFDSATPLEIESADDVLRVVPDTSDDDLAEYDRDAGLYTATLPADTPTFLWVSNADHYRLKLRFPNGAREPMASDTPLTASLDLESRRVAAYRSYGQRIGGALVVENSSEQTRQADLEWAASDHRWRVRLDRRALMLPPGETVRVPLQVLVPDDTWADRPVRVTMAVVDRSGGLVESSVDIVAEAQIEPVDPQRHFALPGALRGGPNVAWDVLGGRWPATPEQHERDEIKGVGSGYSKLFDGMAVQGQGLTISRNQNEPEVVVDLAGDAPVPVAGIAVNPLGELAVESAPRRFALDLSEDGESFVTVLEAGAEPIPAEQAFVLDAPVPARFARLRFQDAYMDEDLPPFGLGEWKVVARPGTDLTAGAGHDLAAPEAGGHVVWAQPKISETWDNTVLREDEKDPTPARLYPGETLEWVVAFHHQRAARIAILEWLPDADAEDSERVDRVMISVAVDSPFGPWKRVAEWALEDSDVQTLTLEDQPWARYVKFSVPGGTELVRRAPPERVRIFERPSGEDYRSVLTEWGFASSAAFYESIQPIEPRPPFRPSGNNDRASAAALEPGQTAAGQVLLGRESDWYRLRVPDGMNLLSLTMSAQPTVRTRLHLEDPSGEPVPLGRRGRETASHRYEAVVEPGTDYWVRVEEPPRNVVFSWDTSASVGRYLPVVYNALMAYAEDVVPGRDGVNFIPFGGSLLAGDWYGEPYVIQTLLNELPRRTSSSAAEKTLTTASRALGPRPGTKAVVLITDAATPRHEQVWQAFRDVRPRIFSLGLSSAGAFSRNPLREQDLLQGWSDVNGGHYDHVLSAGEMEVAFDRAATLLRAPAPYELTASLRFDENAGKPGTLTVVSGTDGEEGTLAHGAVELILDASGSMLQRMEGRRRIEIARQLLKDAVSDVLPEGTPVALRVFGHREPNACRTDLVQSLSPLDAEVLTGKLNSIDAMNLARTPIAASLAEVPDDLGSASGRKTVVLVTDGEETCEGDPRSVIQSLVDAGMGVTLNIVGFAIEEQELSATFREWADAGGGRYFPAGDSEELYRALASALRVGYRVQDEAGDSVAEGEVDGDPVVLEPGFYDVTVDAEPAVQFESVEVTSADDTALVLE